MRVFDWVRFLEEHRIPYVTSGANVKRGEVAIRCPFCGSADPSHHMGLSLATGWYSCWRNRAQHSGKSPLRLIMKLLGVPYGRARELAGLGDDFVDPEGFDAIAARILHLNPQEPVPSKAERRHLELERGFVPIKETGWTRLHWRYLFGRGFDMTQGGIEEVDLLCQQYGLMACRHSPWNDRVIIPYHLYGELVTWSARAIGDARIRYRDLDLEDSLLAPKNTLYNADCMLEGGRVLVLTEGPFDVLKLDFYGRRYGVRAVGLSTNSISDRQAHLLSEAVGKFERLVVMLDTKNIMGIVDSMAMKQQLSFLDIPVTTCAVPYGAGDGGNMTGTQVIQWSKEITSGKL
jgi:hypothetical protein